MIKTANDGGKAFFFHCHVRIRVCLVTLQSCKKQSGEHWVNTKQGARCTADADSADTLLKPDEAEHYATLLLIYLLALRGGPTFLGFFVLLRLQ
jgi:hypothetical protein